MSMRLSPKKTETYFKSKSVNYTSNHTLIDDIELHYITTGQKDAPTLVFIHGSPGSWDAYKSYLSDSTWVKQFRLIGIDRPGFGYSDYRQPKDLEAQAVVLNKLLSRLNNNKPYTLLGHSYGGPLIVKMAVTQPKLYDNLVIIAGSLDPLAEKPEKWRIPLKNFPLKYIVPGALRPSNEELWWLKDDLFSLEDELFNLNQNTLIIHGTKDKLVPYSNMNYMQKQFINAKSIETNTLKDKNHFILWEEDALLKQYISEWLLKVQL